MVRCATDSWLLLLPLLLLSPQRGRHQRAAALKPKGAIGAVVAAHAAGGCRGRVAEGGGGEGCLAGMVCDVQCFKAQLGMHRLMQCSRH